MKKSPPKAVLFVPNTVDSALANEIRENVQSLRPWTAINIKIVERAGEKLQDILCKSNPWGSQDCKRENCFSCEAATKFEDCRSYMRHGVRRVRREKKKRIIQRKRRIRKRE